MAESDTASLARLEERVDTIIADVGQIKTAITTLIRVEERQAHLLASLERAFREIGVLNKRVTSLEQAAPTTEMVKRWVVNGVLAVAGVVGLGLVALVVAG